jgi:hypothetical protein
MPIVPDQPFPKTTGNPIRSKDWNDLVYETQRLDTAKVNKAGDGMTGPLTIAAALNQAALGVGTTTPQARLHVQDGANPTTLRIQSTASAGRARLELWGNPQGSTTEWRPGFLESFDLGNFTGGLSFSTNGVGSANRTGAVEALRLVNGKAGFGVPSPDFRLEVADRIRLRQGPSGTAGMWLFQTTPNADRAFIGMQNDNLVGLWGNGGAQWALNMDVGTGNVGIRTSPAASGGAALNVNGNVTVNGRVSDSKLRMEAAAHSQISISNTANTTVWANVPTLSLTVNSPGAHFLIQFSMGGVQATGVTNAHAEFQLLINDTRNAYTMHEYHNNGYELREVSLQRMRYLSPGTYTVVVQWSVKSPQAGTVTMRGGWYNDTRSLIAIEL